MKNPSKLCASCGAEKGITEFYTKKHKGVPAPVPQCKTCYNARRDSYPLTKFKAAFAMRRRDAEKRGVPFSIQIEDLLPLPTLCPVLGLPIQHGKAGGEDGSPSIDRIVPTKGYVPGNVIVVSLKANRIKNDATPEELMAVAKFYVAL